MVRAWHNQANDKHTANVEHQNTPESPSDRNGDVPARVLSLADCHTNQFRSDVCEEGVGQGAPEAKEDREVVVVDLCEEIRSHRSVWVLPVAEAIAIVVWITAEVDDNTHEDESDEGYHLYGAEPVFEFTEYTDAEEVYKED